MRGKPKGIRRKEAGQKDSLFEKAIISTHGDLADWVESLLYERLKALHLGQEYITNCKKKPKLVPVGIYRVPMKEFIWMKHKYLRYAGDFFVSAVIENNVEFFQLLAKIAQWHRDGKRPADRNGILVILAQIALKKADKPHGSKPIAAFIKEHVKIWLDDAVVRRTLRELGIKKSPR